MGNSFFFGSPRQVREGWLAERRQAYSDGLVGLSDTLIAELRNAEDRQIAAFREVLRLESPHRLTWFDMLARADQVRVSTPLRRERSDDQKDYAECAYERDGSNPHEYPW